MFATFATLLALLSEGAPAPVEDLHLLQRRAAKLSTEVVVEAVPKGLVAADQLDVKGVEAAHEEATHVATPCRSKEKKENQSQCIVATVLDVFDVLQSTADLSPLNAEVDKALTALVSMVLVPQPAEVVTAVLEDPQVRAIKKPLWHFLSEAEYEMESWWARRFLAEHATMEGTSAFWYRENYKELTALELAHLHKVGHRPSAGDHVVFVGGGPLPFSAIEYMLQSGAKVTVVEHNPWAVQLSTVLIKQLGLENVAVEYAAGERFDYAGATHLIVAALVRHDDAVIRRAMDTADLRMVGVRSADGLRSLLYAPLDGSLDQLHLQPTGGSAVNARVINTLLTFEPAHAKQF